MSRKDDAQLAVSESDTATTVGRDADVETRADRLIEVEETLHERLDDADRAESRVELEPSARLAQCRDCLAAVRSRRVSPFTEAPIVDADVEQSADEITFVCEPAPGERVSYALSLPSDMSDHDNPLVRLCRHRNVPLDRVADLSNLPLAEDDDGEWRLVVPPRRRTRDFTLAIDGHDVLGQRARVPVRDRLEGLNHRLVRRLSALPLYTIQDIDDSGLGVDVTNEVALGVHFLVLLALGAIIGVVATSSPLAPLVGAFLAIFAGTLPFACDNEFTEYHTPDAE